MYLPILVMVLPPAASAATHLLRMILKKRRTVCWVLAGAAIILQVIVMHNLNDYHKAIRTIPDDRAKLDGAVKEMLDSPEAYILDAHVCEMGMVYPMVPGGRRLDEILLNKDEWYRDGE